MTRIFGYALDPESGHPRPGSKVRSALWPQTKATLQGPVADGADEVTADTNGRWELNLLPTAGRGVVVRLMCLRVFDIYADIPEATPGGAGDTTPIDVSTLLVDPNTLEPAPNDPSVYVPRALLGQPNGVATLGSDGILTASQRPAGGGGGGGDAVRVAAVAAAALSGHRVVTFNSSGQFVYADNTNAAHRATPLLVTENAISSGVLGSGVSYGLITEPSWNWTAGPVYLGAAGALTQTPPTVPAFLCVVGFSTSPTTLFVDRQPSVLLAS